MANEVKKLIKMGIETPQTRYLIMKEKTALKWGDEYHVVDHSEPRHSDNWSDDLRVNELGQIVQPPIAPEKPNTKNWKRMTPKRRELLHQYKMDKEQYDKEREEWLQLPHLNDGRSVEEHRAEFLRNRPVMGEGINHRTFYDYMNRVFNPEPAVLTYWVKGFGEVSFLEHPRFYSSTYMWFYPTTTEEDDETSLSEWMGDLPVIEHESRNYKRNRDINEVLTRTEQLDLFNCRTADTGVRIVDYRLLESFGTKPNKYLANAYLDYLLRGTPLTDWQKFQINKRMTKTIVKEGQQTLL